MITFRPHVTWRLFSKMAAKFICQTMPSEPIDGFVLF